MKKGHSWISKKFQKLSGACKEDGIKLKVPQIRQNYDQKVGKQGVII